MVAVMKRWKCVRSRWTSDCWRRADGVIASKLNARSRFRVYRFRNSEFIEYLLNARSRVMTFKTLDAAMAAADKEWKELFVT
jgi:hypothetical protein